MLLITVSIIVVVPLTFKLLIIFTLFKTDCPETFNDDTNVVLFDNVVVPDTFNLSDIVKPFEFIMLFVF